MISDSAVMKPEEINSLLQSGIGAAKGGNRSEAREIFLAIVEEDQDNEQAWLWLSSVVDSDEDRRISLENVLVINPENSAAKRGLEQLVPVNPQETSQVDEVVVRRHYEPVSPAASILYPDHNIKEWRWHEPAVAQQDTSYGYLGQSSYQDVWEGEGDICPFCASELDFDEWRCSQCKQNLKHAYYRYPKASSDLIIYLVLILGVAQLSFLLILMQLVIGNSLLSLIWQTLVFISMLVLGAGIYLRRFWSYLGSIVTLIMILISILISIFVFPEAGSALDMAIADGFFQALADNPYLFAIEPFIGLVIPLQLLAAFLALLFALFRVGPDFERVTVRRIGQLDKGITGASMFYAHGKSYAGEGMWANAVLHYRRSAALEPTKAFYLGALGEAYDRLGYYQRSLDVLESAYQIETDSQQKTHRAAVLSSVREKLQIQQREEVAVRQALENGK